MAKKKHTNTTMLIDLIQENDKTNPLLNVILRERIVCIMEQTVEAIKNNPSDWENGIIHPSLYNLLDKKVKISIGFGEENKNNL